MQTHARRIGSSRATEYGPGWRDDDMCANGSHRDDDCEEEQRIEALKQRTNVFLTNTDHLSDSDLYSALWHRVLRDEVPVLPDVPGSASHVDMVGTGSEEDIRLYLRCYADEDWRGQWVVDFPDYDVPAHVDPPYDRDGHLPRPRFRGLDQ